MKLSTTTYTNLTSAELDEIVGGHPIGIVTGILATSYAIGYGAGRFAYHITH